MPIIVSHSPWLSLAWAVSLIISEMGTLIDAAGRTLSPLNDNSQFPSFTSLHFADSTLLAHVRLACDPNRLKYTIELSDRRRIEGLFIKTFSRVFEWGSAAPFSSCFLHAALEWREVSRSRFSGGIELWMSGISSRFVVVFDVAWCASWGAEMRRKTTSAEKKSQMP